MESTDSTPPLRRPAAHGIQAAGELSARARGRRRGFARARHRRSRPQRARPFPIRHRLGRGGFGRRRFRDGPRSAGHAARDGISPARDSTCSPRCIGAIRRRRRRLVFRCRPARRRPRQILRLHGHRLPASGRALQPMVIYPLFSKWGATNLGLVDGGVRLFYLESVSGVIQWIFAAPLFSHQSVLPDGAGEARSQAAADAGQQRRRPAARRQRHHGAALGPLDGARHLHLPESRADGRMVQSGRHGAQRRRDGDVADLDARRLRAMEPRRLHGASCL